MIKIVMETQQIKHVVTTAKNEDATIKIAGSFPEEDFEFKEEVLEPVANEM